MRQENLYVRSIAVDGLLDYVKSQGGDVPAIARAAKLDISSRGRTHGVLGWDKFSGFVELAAKALNDPHFGINWALSLPRDFRSSGPNLILAMTVRDLQQLLNMAIQYQLIHTNVFQYAYREDPSEHTLRGEVSLHPLSRQSLHCLEHVTSVIVQMGRMYVPGLTINQVRFKHRPLGDISFYEKAFGCPVEFNANRTEIIAPVEALKIKLGNRASVGKPILRGYLNYHLSKVQKKYDSVGLSVSGALVSMLGVQTSNLDAVAQFLDINPKKLQRLLKDEDTSFSRVLDSTRQSMASRLLVDSGSAIWRIAGMLDYNSSEAFIAAVKRWFGQTPSLYRKSSREK